MGQLGDLSPQASIAVSIGMGLPFCAPPDCATGWNTRRPALDINTELGVNTTEEVASA